MTEQNHCMVDLETLDVSATAVILSIGAVAFDPLGKGIGEKFYSVISVQSCMDAGLSTNPDTVAWWLRQSKEAQTVLTEAKASDKGLQTVLEEFSEWWKTNNLKYLWGNGAAFDNAIMSNAYKVAGIKQPWLCWNDRCYRTLKSMTDVKLVRHGTYHNALDDAISQAVHMQDFMGSE